MTNKLKTGIEGFDHISHGGLPRNRATLVAGTAGSAKTLFAAQFLAMGIHHHNENGVFVTFEETPDDIRDNLSAFGWNIAEWEEQKKWAFVDISPNLDEETHISGDYELSAIIARIKYAVKEVKATRLSFDSLGALFSQLDNNQLVRRELFSIVSALKKLGVTSIVTAERNSDYGAVSQFGVEEFVADNVVLLRNPLDMEKRRRTIEILKFRGSNHEKGECPFTIIEKAGLTFNPLSSMSLTQRSSTTRIHSGVDALDGMCGGGFFRDSIILVSGATGTGKSLTVNHYANGAAAKGDRAMVFAFEESKDQFFRNATGWGMNFEELEQNNLLSVRCQYPETASLEEHLYAMQNAINEFKPSRVAVDSLSALERISVPKAFREFVLSLSSFLKEKEVAGLLTSTTPSLLGGPSITESHISTITDSIILLRYVELNGEMQRGITVLKMRGSMHDKQIRRFNIDHQGMHIGDPFLNVTGILAGHPVQRSQSEFARLDAMFDE